MSIRIETYDSVKGSDYKYSKNEAFSVRGAGVDIGEDIPGGGGEPSEQVQANWTQSDSSKVDYIKNKPSLWKASMGNESVQGGSSACLGDYSFAFGYGAIIKNPKSVMFGSFPKEIDSYSKPNSYTIFSVGNGTEDNARSNAFEVRSDGTVIEGTSNVTGASSHAEGYGCTVSGTGSHAEGWSSSATANNCHAEGYSTTASGNGSHAEGDVTVASGGDSHAEGSNTTASGANSHAGGHESIASASHSFAHGYYTSAANNSSVAFGYANSEVLSTDSQDAYTIFSVGNGTVSGETITRSNAFEVRKDGAAYAGGSKVVTVNQLADILATASDFDDFKTAIAALIL